ncbi:chromosomal replication initiator protein DnaA [bacterium]|nr:chromosomal replication initiator protein DnaA [bacterium]
MQQVWDDFLKIIREEAGNQVLETWFQAVRFGAWNPATNTATLYMPNQFVSLWIKDHYLPLMKEHLSRLLYADELSANKISEEGLSADGLTAKELLADRLSLEFICIPKETVRCDIVPASVIVPEKEQPTEKRKNGLTLHTINPRRAEHRLALRKARVTAGSKVNPRYTFDSFIVGPHNSLAYAAASAIAKEPGKTYNPLLIYGGTGLGKTHLLHCIGNEALNQNPDMHVCYENSDRFMSEFINAIRQKNMHQFRKKYEALDLLLIDDVQFFSNKEQTQETFFHIFNGLYEKNRQIVLSCDIHPGDIPALQERIKSRLGWGLVVDIQIPTLETRIAILMKKAEELDIKISEEVASFVASKTVSNIRELEGALTRIAAFAGHSDEEITAELADKLFSNHKRINPARPSIHHVAKIIARHYNLSVDDIRSKKRDRQVTAARQETIYLMKKMTNATLRTIGEYLGGRDHSTVIYAANKIEKEIKKDKNLVSSLVALEQKISTER